MINYDKYLKNRVVIVSGVGRSGTTILGKIIGSAKNVFYFFEPAIMKYFPAFYFPFNDEVKRFRDCFLGTLFEDYILPAVQGRNINFNTNDWSYYGNYQTLDELKNRWKLTRRDDALEWLEQSDPLFIFKVNESQYLWSVYDYYFPDLRIINIDRDMIRVVNSAIKRGWFTDSYDPIDLSEKYNYIMKYNTPIYIERKYSEDWGNKWNPETRAAYSWARLNYYRLRHIRSSEVFSRRTAMINYEKFCLDPKNITDNIFEWLNLKPTDLTRCHINSVDNHIDMFDVKSTKEIEKKIMVNIDYNNYTVSDK